MGHYDHDKARLNLDDLILYVCMLGKRLKLSDYLVIFFFYIVSKYIFHLTNIQNSKVQ